MGGVTPSILITTIVVCQLFFYIFLTMDGNGQVLEGFICPICMNDCKTPQQLTKHFEEFHDDNPEILKSLKGKQQFFQ